MDISGSCLRVVSSVGHLGMLGLVSNQTQQNADYSFTNHTVQVLFNQFPNMILQLPSLAHLSGDPP